MERDDRHMKNAQPIEVMEDEPFAKFAARVVEGGVVTDEQIAASGLWVAPRPMHRGLLAWLWRVFA